jgi:endonuclease/exonuclease/phosphatase family metal-dependent hydrolase
VGNNLRVVTLNFWGTEPPLERRIALATRQLKALNVDVVCMQEVRPLDGKQGKTTAEVIAGELGMAAHYAVAVEWEDGAHAKLPAGQEGLAIIAKNIVNAAALPLPEPRVADARLLLSAQVATEGGPIWIHTTHLHYRLDDGVAREHQVLAVDEAIRACGRGNTDSPQILCGDMNAVPDSDEMRFLRGLTTLGGRRTHFQDAWLRIHGPAKDGITWSSENCLTRALRSLDIDRRLDYIYVTSRKKDGRGTIHDCRVVLDEREEPGDICASDHYGVLAEIQVVPTAS